MCLVSEVYVIYLDVYVTIKLCAVYPPASDEQPYCAGIHNLTTHKTYGTMCCHTARWALTPPFHPYHLVVAVILCYATPPSRMASR